MSGRPKLLGIVNVTEDSFSDGGRFLDPDAAIAHARALAAGGADILDLGAAASNPSAKPVAPQLEIERLLPLVEALSAEGVNLSVDSSAVETQRWALSRRVAYLNDVRGFPETNLYPALAASQARLIVMHATKRGNRDAENTPDIVFAEILAFFESRIAALTGAGIARDRLILDPGMGFFLSRDPEVSFFALRKIEVLRNEFGLPVLISVSRKSFLRAVTGRTPCQSWAATLAAELFAARHGADFIRTHDPGALKDALTVAQRLDEPHPSDLAFRKISQRSGQNPLL